MASIYPDTWDQYSNGEGKGPLSSTGGCAGLAHVHSGINTDKSRPDVQFHLLGLTVATDYGLILKENLGFYLNTIKQLFLFVEQLDQLEVCLPYSRILAGIPILAVFQNLRWNSNKTSLDPNFGRQK